MCVCVCVCMCVCVCVYACRVRHCQTDSMWTKIRYSQMFSLLPAFCGTNLRMTAKNFSLKVSSLGGLGPGWYESHGCSVRSVVNRVSGPTSGYLGSLQVARERPFIMIAALLYRVLFYTCITWTAFFLVLHLLLS